MIPVWVKAHAFFVVPFFLSFATPFALFGRNEVADRNSRTSDVESDDLNKYAVGMEGPLSKSMDSSV